jgi:pyruvate kinase
MAAWADCIGTANFGERASNLAHYLALRHRDLRPLQRPLMMLGLSSLGRLESRVVPTLVAVRAALAALAGLAPEKGPSTETFFAGERRLVERTHELLDASASSRAVALLVTCPTEAAAEPSFMQAARRAEWRRCASIVRATMPITGGK